MTNNLTIVIPTFNRNNLLLRGVDYYNSINVSVLIVDSSLKPFKNELPDNFEYLHLPNAFFGDKIYKALCMVTTKYACLCADDDFLSENGLRQGIKFLESHPDYVSVMGHYINFDSSDINNIQPSYVDCINYKNDSNEIIERLKGCFKAPQVYALHRTKDIKDCIEITIGISAISVVEMSIPLVSLVVGKHKFLPVYWGARDRRRYSEYIDTNGDVYKYAQNVVKTSNKSSIHNIVISDWESYLNSNEGVQFRANFKLKMTTLNSNRIESDELFDLAFDPYIEKEKKALSELTLFPLNQGFRNIIKVILPKKIVKKIQSRSIKRYAELHAKFYYPWNDKAVMNEWSVMKKIIMKFNH